MASAGLTSPSALTHAFPHLTSVERPLLCTTPAVASAGLTSPSALTHGFPHLTSVERPLLCTTPVLGVVPGNKGRLWGDSTD